MMAIAREIRPTLPRRLIYGVLNRRDVGLPCIPAVGLQHFEPLYGVFAARC